MPKKKFLVKEAGLVDFFKSFFNAKAKGKEASFIQQIRKQNPELGDVWSDWNDKMDTMLKNTKKDLQHYNLDTTEIDNVLKKYK